MWHQRLLPYPLLSKTTDDYPLSGFGCQVRNSVLSNGEVINLALEYQLNWRISGISNWAAPS